MRKAIIVGASSGIGKELSTILSENGFSLGLVARRLHLLNELSSSLPGETIVKQIDVSKTDSAINEFSELISEMGQLDLVVISSGIGDINNELNWQITSECINTNVLGFTGIANVAIKHFIKEGSGHLVGISSIAAIRGGKGAPSYNASKAFISNYLEGLRQKVATLNKRITVTDVKPGYVDTSMAKGEGLFWVASPEKAATQIFRAIVKKKSHVYVTKRWRLIGQLLKVLPESIYNKL